MEIVAARLDTEGIEEFKRVTRKNKSEVVRELVEAGKKHYAVDLYKERKVSLGLGAKLAGVTLSEFFELLAEHNVPLNQTLDDAKLSFATAEKIVQRHKG